MKEERKPMLSLTVFNDGTFEWLQENGKKVTGKWDSMKAIVVSMGLLMAGVVGDKEKTKK